MKFDEFYLVKIRNLKFEFVLGKEILVERLLT
jgi:hypothetical protein